MFKLDPEFVQHYRSQPSPLNTLGQVIFARTYSRMKEDGSNEWFQDMLQRVTEGTFSVLKSRILSMDSHWDESRAQRKAQKFYLRMFNLKWLPPGRGAWAMGSPVVDKLGSVALNNCGAVSTEDIDKDFAYPFCTLMDYSALGVGMGFNTKGAGKVTIVQPLPNIGENVYVVSDDREGWVDLVRTILKAYRGWYIPTKIDYSKIRPKGSIIKTFGGISSGYEPLAQLVEDIHSILKPLIGKPITSVAITDLCNVIGKCIVSGNVRRSAEIAIGHWSDKEFLEMKDPTKYEKELQYSRWCSNNTVAVDDCPDMNYIVDLIGKNGEPGLCWFDTIRSFGRLADPPDYKDRNVSLFNPCSEIPLENNELCCLSETFPSNHSTLADYLETLRYAYLYAKVVSLIPTHNEHTNEVISRNHRIGISMAGIAELYSKLGMQESMRWWDAGYKYVKLLDEDYSTWLKVGKSIRLTTVKPGGTIPLVVGVEGGLKYPVSQFYYRTVRFADNSPLLPQLESSGYRIEPDYYSPSTAVVYFPQESKSKVFADTVSIWEQVALMSALQHSWSDNMVSCTVSFKKHEVGEISRVLDLYKGKLKTISFLPYSDHNYKQAPYQPISESEYAKEVDRLKSGAMIADGAHEADKVDRYCSGDKCLI